MSFEVTYPTRHTDAFASTGFVHAGVLLGLTEMAYADFEAHCGVEKPDSTYAVQRATEATYSSPLKWDEGVRIVVRTTLCGPRNFDQEFEILSARDGRRVAIFVHHWVWYDTASDRPVEIDEATRNRLLDR